MKIKSVNWKPAFRYRDVQPAEVVHDELEKLRAKYGGEFEPQHIVDAASAKRSKLHLFFEWEDGAAANEYRLTQARHLLRCIEVVYEEAPEQPVRRYQVDWKPDRSGKRYRATEDLLTDDDARAELLKRALLELLAIRRKFATLQELSIVFRSIDETLENYHA